MKKTNRRIFLKATGLTMAGAAAFPLMSSAGKVNKSTSNLKLGLASYTFRKFNLDDTLNYCTRVGLKYICLKSMHLPLDSTPEKINEVRDLIKSKGITLYGGGVIYMSSKDQVDQAFEYAKNAGMSVMVGVPDYDLLDYSEEKVKKYDIKLAIHNHGPNDKHYPGPGSVYERVKDRDKRMGLCMDIGHTARMGLDPATEAKKYFDRLFDCHLKDVTSATNEGQSLEVGRGVIDIPKFLGFMQKNNFQGVLSFEHEKDGDDPMPGLCESVGYARGVLATLA